jgi:tetratricopeptide (TPR) repeat protein
MSLLLDARKKSQQAQPAQQGGHTPQGCESSPMNPPPESGRQARNAGHNLFAAKSPHPMDNNTPPSRHLLRALGGTILLLATGVVYFWPLDSASNTFPLYPVRAQLPPAPAREVLPAAQPDPLKRLVPEIAAADSAGAILEHRQISPTYAAKAPGDAPQLHNITPTRPDSHPAHPNNTPISIEQQKTEPPDPLLMDAYLAYRDGQLDKARQLYLAMFDKDAGNPDVLLGLAAIAQQQGENQAAAQFFGLVLALDPRNAAANAGMAGLNADLDYSESRLKILLHEQGNSATLHFALGNLHAGQSRWGEAQQAYFNAYARESGNADYAFNLAVSLDHLGQKKLAMQHYRHAIQLDPLHRAGFDHAQISQRAQELAR